MKPRIGWRVQVVRTQDLPLVQLGRQIAHG